MFGDYSFGSGQFSEGETLTEGTTGTFPIAIETAAEPSDAPHDNEAHA